MFISYHYYQKTPSLSTVVNDCNRLIVTARYSEFSSPFMADLHPTVDLMPLKPNDRFVRFGEVRVLNFECFARSTEHQ